jgi:hypothetical protein
MEGKPSKPKREIPSLDEMIDKFMNYCGLIIVFYWILTSILIIIFGGK